MVETATVSNLKPTTKPMLMGQAWFKGKIVYKRKTNKIHRTLLALPAPDEFSHPRTVEVSSLQPLGDIDDMVEVQVLCTGYARNMEWADKETGEKKTARTADCSYQAIED